MKDFNVDPAEYGKKAGEYNAAEENAPFSGNPEAVELNPETPRPKKRKKRGGQGLIAGLSAAAVVLVAAVAVLPADNVDAEIASAETTNTTVSYEIRVDSEETLDAVLYNDFIRRSFPLERGENRNVFEGLRADTEYTLAIMGNFGFGERAVKELTVKTSATADPVTEWRDRVELNCRCAIDGYFYFRMDFVDENGYFTDFEGTLTDRNGKISHCDFTEDLHDWQRIDVANEAKLVGREMRLLITCRTSEPAAEQERRVLFDQNVRI